MADRFEELRNSMVDAQLASRGISDGRVLGAMRAVPRHLFVPADQRPYSYDDCALPIGHGQTISQPYMVALMTQELRLSGRESVLEVGTGSGYQAAVLGRLAKRVLTVERIKPLAEAARKTLAGLGYDNIEVIWGDGSKGLPGKAPFDRIILTAACDSPPDDLVSQLADGGIMVAPVGEGYEQVLTSLVREGGTVRARQGVWCVFVPLVASPPVG